MKRKRIITSSVLFLFVLISMHNSYAEYYQPTVLENVNIYIDDQLYQSKDNFYDYRYTTFVPMRELFEKLGAKVDWDKDSRTVIAKKDDLLLTINIDAMTTELNGSRLTPQEKPIIIGQKLYLPLRFVAESFGYIVDWNGIDRIITIVDLSKIKIQDKVYYYSSSDYFKEQYLSMEITEQQSLKIKGRTSSDKTDWMIKIKDLAVSDNKRKDVLKEFFSVQKAKYNCKLPLTDYLRKDGRYEVLVFFKLRGESSYYSEYNGIILTRKDDEIYFERSPIFAQNYVHYLKTKHINPQHYLQLDLGPTDQVKIQELAKKIVGSEDDDYKKIKKINDWVADNIYYDLDAYYQGNYGRTDAIGTLESKKSVCQGYAELTNSLLRASGIPSRVVSGFALGLGSGDKTWKDFSPAELESSNHAWNEAYVNGRWMILDVTWNSRNDYENGQFVPDEKIYHYFDINLEAFSYDHLYLD